MFGPGKFKQIDSNSQIPPWGAVILHDGDGHKTIMQTAESFSQQASLVPSLHAPPGKNSIVNEIEFLGLIPQKW